MHEGEQHKLSGNRGEGHHSPQPGTGLLNTRGTTSYLKIGRISMACLGESLILLRLKHNKRGHKYIVYS